ncbi:hypothetical protein BPTFM16_01263 [Altererythrobacter insulae]|nr:hypothetical protein BPTFM16_01263 [Altererythrobacter insulae]
MAQFMKLAAVSGALAAASFAAPAAAAELPAQTPVISDTIPQYDIFDADEMTAEHHRRYRYRGYGYGYRHRRHRVRAGDVIAGALIIGGIAAIANAATKNERRNRDERYRDDRYRDNDRDRRDTRRSSGGRGIDGAVDRCLSEIERDVRVDEVQSVDRNGEGWRVTGTLFNGDRFTCTIGSDGRIDNVDYGGGFAAQDRTTDDRSQQVRDNQHSDDRYRAAWNQVDGDAPVEIDADAKRRSQQTAAYPGGPVDGDLEAAATDKRDDRYTMAEAPAT